MDYHSSKHKELSEQLTTWWLRQTDFKTKKALAGLLKVHPDTLGDYFAGRKFPKSDIANRLFELTNIACLKPDAGATPISEMTQQESSRVPTLSPAPSVAVSVAKHPEPDITGVVGPSNETYHWEKTPQVTARQMPRESLKKGSRYEERSVVISLQSTSCPFCKHNIAKFVSCLYCGQQFVWANVPKEEDKLT